jgi:hypothetical protein
LSGKSLGGNIVAKKKAAASKPARTSEAKKPTSTASKSHAKKGATSVKPASKDAAPIVAEAIGECAGVVWSCLNNNGPQPITNLKKSVDAPADLVLTAIGWLAREGKLAFDTNGKAVTVSLV